MPDIPLDKVVPATVLSLNLATNHDAGWRKSRTAAGHDKVDAAPYIHSMRALIILALFGLLALAVWFAGTAWVHLGGDDIPFYGWFAIAGGVLVSLGVGGGLMALVFYSSRHGYDDDANHFR
jgi:hypothetical protein